MYFLKIFFIWSDSFYFFLLEFSFFLFLGEDDVNLPCVYTIISIIFTLDYQVFILIFFFFWSFIISHFSDYLYSKCAAK